jgi:6-phosphogluconolactonase
MKQPIAVFALAAVAAAACSPNRGIANATGPAAVHADRLGVSAADPNGAGVVYALTNQTSGNAVASFARAADGTLTAAATVSTGGTGTGSGLGSQGALALTDGGRMLFAVNAGSNEISAFVANPEGRLSLTARVASGGTQPISLTAHAQLLYVLNAGGSGNISGFTIGANGALSAIPGSTRPLTGATVGPAQVAFSPDGRLLVVTEKNPNLIAVYTVGLDGLASGPTSVASAGVTPFGFAFGPRDGLFVSEAAGTASSYAVGEDGRLTLVSGAVATHQGAPCWLVVTSDGRFAYTANARSGTISGFRVAPDASLSLLDASGQTASVGAGNIDLALTTNSQYLYQLHGGGTITELRVRDDGALESIGVGGGLPAGTVGLAAR